MICIQLHRLGIRKLSLNADELYCLKKEIAMHCAQNNNINLLTIKYTNGPYVHPHIRTYVHILYSLLLTFIKQACKLAVDEGWAVNLGGGFGYNTTHTSKGLGVYDDIPVCLAVSCNHTIVSNYIMQISVNFQTCLEIPY